MAHHGSMNWSAIPRRRWPVLVVGYLIAWGIPSLISITQLSLSYRLRGDYPPLDLLLKIVLPGWYAWALLAPIIALIAWRLPLGRNGWPARLAIHLLANTVITALWVGLVVTTRRIFGLPGVREFRLEFVNAVGAALLTYWVIVLVVHLVRSNMESRARALRAAELDAELSRTRFRALSARLQPHFLFNTMNAISAFLRSDPDRAETMLASLAELLRMVLEAPDSEMIPLSHEVEFTRRYLELQRIRMEGRIEISLSVAGPVDGVLVPTLLIQPLVENAVEHGVGARMGTGRVDVDLRVGEGRVRFEVSDNGPGLPPGIDEPGADRVGLRTTRERLAALFGDDFSLRMENRPEGGVLAVLDVPATPIPEAS